MIQYALMKGKLIDAIYVPTTQELEAEKIWIIGQIEKIGEEKLNNLAEEAVKVRKNAYEPQSKYKVGAALIAKSGRTFSSCNAETVTLTETDHAERGVITRAISEGEVKESGRKFIEAIAVSHSEESAPCGGCRQRIVEHADNCLILDVDGEGNIQAITSLKAMLPYAFTPSNLEQK